MLSAITVTLGIDLYYNHKQNLCGCKSIYFVYLYNKRRGCASPCQTHPPPMGEGKAVIKDYSVTLKLEISSLLSIQVPSGIWTDLATMQN